MSREENEITPVTRSSQWRRMVSCVENTCQHSKSGSETIEHYQNLANAIILSAVKDWRVAVKRLKKRPKNESSRQMKRECERFFLSEWFVLLTSVDGEGLLQKLKREAGVK